MTYVCEHCRHTSSNWIETGGAVCCPKCYKFTPKEKAVIRRPAKDMAPDILRDLFGLWK